MPEREARPRPLCLGGGMGILDIDDLLAVAKSALEEYAARAKSGERTARFQERTGG